MDAMNNLTKKQVSCRNNSSPDGLWRKNIVDFKNMGNTIQDLCNEDLHGKGSYTLDDGMQGFGFDSKNKEGSEHDIGEHDEEAQA